MVSSNRPTVCALHGLAMEAVQKFIAVAPPDYEDYEIH